MCTSVSAKEKVVHTGILLQDDQSDFFSVLHILFTAFIRTN